MRRWNRYIDGEKAFPTMGWMQFRHIEKVKRFFVDDGGGATGDKVDDDGDDDEKIFVLNYNRLF